MEPKREINGTCSTLFFNRIQKIGENHNCFNQIPSTIDSHLYVNCKHSCRSLTTNDMLNSHPKIIQSYKANFPIWNNYQENYKTVIHDSKEKASNRHLVS